MISRVLIIFLLIVCFSCNSNDSEQKLLNKSNATGFYGNMSKIDKVYGASLILSEKNDTSGVSNEQSLE